jgi:SAM-dependent methyltransferase
MQKEFYFNSKPQNELWDSMWTGRTIEHELEQCDMEVTRRDLLLSYLPKEGKILDAGCGFGKLVIYLKRRGYNITGIDNNELAVAKLKEFDKSLQVELGDILNIHYPDNSFDAYISMGVVEHFENGPLPALKEAHRVLKPYGLIFVSVPTANIIRQIIRQPFRKAINALPVSFILLRSGWVKSKRGAIFAALGNILPEKAKAMVLGKGRRYYHFAEYRYSKSELENFLRESGFEIVETVPDDFNGSKNHAAGLVVDFPFLGASNGVNFQLNPFGKLIWRTLDTLSPWIACASVLCVGRSKKSSNEDAYK